MRVLFVAHGPAHVPWIVPLAWACQLAGDEVRVAARPQAMGKVTAAGLIGVPMGKADEVDAIFTIDGPTGDAPAPKRIPDGWPVGPLPWSASRRATWADTVVRLADLLADDLVAFARHWRPDIVVHDTGAVVGLVAAAAVGVPAIGHGWGHSMGAYFKHAGEVPPSYLRMFERFGLPPALGEPVWIDPCPPSLRRPYPVRRLDLRYVPYCGPGEVPDWLADPVDRPRVCLSGGVTTRTFSVLKQRLLDAVDGIDADVLLAVARPAEFDGLPLPANVRVIGWCPLPVLLPTCATLVHHGGSGTGMPAIHAGVPQVVVADKWDSPQRLWGELAQDAGAGICLDDAAQSDPDQVRAAVLASMATPAYADGARRIRAEIDRMPAPAELVPVLRDYHT